MFGDFFLKIKDLASLGLSNIAQNGIMTLFWFVLVTIVSKDEYGEVTYLISIAVFATGAYQLGLHNLIVVYGAKKENVFYPAYLVGMISSIGASLIVYLLTQNLFISFLVWGTMLFDLMLANLRSKTRFQAFSIYSVLRRTFSLILSLLLYTILGVDGIILGFSIATLLGVIGMYHFFKSQKNGFAVLKSKLGFIINNSIIGLLITFNDSGIKLFIGNLFGFSTLAGFQIAFQYSIMLGLVPMVLSIYLLPKEAKGIKNKKLKIYSIIISVFLALVSIIVVPSAVNLFIPEYNDSVLAIQIMSFSVIAQVISVITETSFLVIEKSRFVLISNVSQIGSFFLIVMILGPEFGLIGISIAYLLSTLARSIFNIVIYQKYFRYTTDQE